jgi:hypothetical protein
MLAARFPKRCERVSNRSSVACPQARWILQRADGTAQARALSKALKKAGSPVDVRGLQVCALLNHNEINRRLVDPASLATPVFAEWLQRLFARPPALQEVPMGNGGPPIEKSDWMEGPSSGGVIRMALSLGQFGTRPFSGNLRVGRVGAGVRRRWRPKDASRILSALLSKLGRAAGCLPLP